MNSKLQAKDLITVGIFTAIYFVVFFASGMLGYIPILFVLMPMYFPIFTAIPFMLFLTKSNKFGMITIMSVMCGILMFATGHTWMPLASSLLCGFIADLIFRAGNYKSFNHSVIGYGVFSIWPVGAMLPLWVMRDTYFAYIQSSMGDTYTEAIRNLTPVWLIFVFIAGAFISGLISAFLGHSVLKKHFKRAGIA